MPCQVVSYCTVSFCLIHGVCVNNHGRRSVVKSRGVEIKISQVRLSKCLRFRPTSMIF